MRWTLLAGWTGLVLLLVGGNARGQWVSFLQGRVYVGPPPHPFPLASDNGIPGTGAYAYNDYDWPSLRQAVQTYGLCGRKVSLPCPAQTAPADEDSPDVPLDRRTAEIRVRLPANAELWSNGKKMKLTGPVQEFVTPRLEEDRVYTYVLRARWVEDGMTVEKTRRVRTFAGNRVTVHFVPPPAATPRRTVVRREAPAGITLPPDEAEREPLEWLPAPRATGMPSQ